MNLLLAAPPYRPARRTQRPCSLSVASVLIGMIGCALFPVAACDQLTAVETVLSRQLRKKSLTVLVHHSLCFHF